MDALIEAGLKGSVVLALGGVAALAARRASAATRHLIWTFALAGALVLPLLSAVLPRVAALPAQFETADQPRRTLRTRRFSWEKNSAFSRVLCG